MNHLIIVAKLLGCLFGPLLIYAVGLKVVSVIRGVDYSGGGWQIIKYQHFLLLAGVVWLAIVLVINSKRQD